MQNRYNLVNREDEREMIPLCLDQGVGIVPYSPLARGLLAGARERDGGGDSVRASADKRPHRPADFDVADAVRAIAAQRRVAPAQIALAWLLATSGVVAPLIGATKPRHLDDAIASTAISLGANEVEQLEASYLPHADGDYT
jgi:aryl-alcohol dehydrogenase-like predicted oxidoreductase